MINVNARSAALAIFALGAGFAASPAFAQVGYAGPAQTVSAQPAYEGEQVVVPPNAIGPFTCAYNERHTHLERQNCGGQHYTYGY